VEARPASAEETQAALNLDLFPRDEFHAPD
jgi:hypothetical protein